MNPRLCVCLFVVVVGVSVTSAYPSRNFIPLLYGNDQELEESAFSPQVVHPEHDLQSAASGHDHHLARVQIKVYRGPDSHHGHEHFAPHGFWVKQPADDHHHY